MDSAQDRTGDNNNKCVQPVHVAQGCCMFQTGPYDRLSATIPHDSTADSRTQKRTNIRWGEPISAASSEIGIVTKVVLVSFLLHFGRGPLACCVLKGSFRNIILPDLAWLQGGRNVEPASIS